MLRFFAVTVSVLLSFGVFADMEVSSGSVVPGQWNSNFTAAKAYAEEHNLPMLVFWANYGCGYCAMLEKAVESADFTAWQARNRLVMVYQIGKKTLDAVACCDFVENDTRLYPYIGVYWPKDDGTQILEKFTGRSDAMPVAGRSLQDALMKSVDRSLVGWDPENYTPYYGGEFVVSDAPGARLEAIAGMTRRVAVPLARTRNLSHVATNELVVGDVVQTVVWGRNVSNAWPVVEIPSDAAAGTEIPLLLKSNGSVHTNSFIHVVSDPGNSVENPYWLGERTAETLSFGEWTMDLDVATNMVASAAARGEKAYTLVLITGTLWCPWCGGLEKGVLNTKAFRDWTRENKIALVQFDNPKRPTNDTVSSSYTEETAETNRVYHVTNVPNGAGPTLLRYDEGVSYWKGAGIYSGAGYLSRKGIVTAEDRKRAEAVLQRNHDLGYVGGAFCEPGTLRSNFGCLVLLDAQGRVRGRYARHAPGMVYGTDENMQRLKDLLLSADEPSFFDDYASTTSLRHELGGTSSAVLRVNERQKVFCLAGVPSSGKLKFMVETNSTHRPVTLKLLRGCELDVTRVTAENLSLGDVPCLVGVPVAESSSGVLEATVDAPGPYFLKVASFIDYEETCYGQTENVISVEVSSFVTLMPVEALVTVPVTCSTYGVQVDSEGGRTYKFSGFTAESLARFFTGPVEGVYTLKSKVEGPISLDVDPSVEEISLCRWNPGRIAIDQADFTLFKVQRSAMVSVTRMEGSSGAVELTLADLGTGTARKGERYVWNDASISWADGESGTKSFEFSMRPDMTVEREETVVLGLVDAMGCAEVSPRPLTITLFDTTKPTLGQTSYALKLYSSFDASAALRELGDVYNVGTGSVRLSKVSGSLPVGVKIAYDKSSKAVALSGTPKLAGRGTVVYLLAEKTPTGVQTGPDLTFEYSVENPQDVNASLGRAIATTLPLFKDEGGSRLLVGTLVFSATSRNRLSAKCVMNGGKTRQTYSGLWSGLEDDGSAWAELRDRTGGSLRLVLTADGFLDAELELFDGGERFRSDPVKIGVALSDYAGYYTVALPARLEGPKAVLSGAGCLLVTAQGTTFDRKGTFKYVLIRPDGRKLTGSSSMSAYDENFALCPVLAVKGGEAFAVPAKVRRLAGKASTRRAVVAVDGSKAHWQAEDADDLRLYDVYGSIYDKNESLIVCCGSEWVKFTADHSAVQGDVAVCPGEDSMLAVTDSTLRPVAAVDGFSFKFNRATGLFSGKTVVTIGKGATRASFTGALVPDWFDCGCGDEDGDALIPLPADVTLPLGVGTCTFNAFMSGKKTVCGFPIGLSVLLP